MLRPVHRPFAHSLRRNAGGRPRVLVVDDHRPILDTVSAILADDFDVVGTATDGHRAIEMARELEPDVVVLDVQMPGIDGFQTLRTLHQTGVATTPAVFLSMHHADEYVSEAFRCGARGYVLKTRIARDLASALDQALLGHCFVPSLTSLFHLGEGAVHAMQLHNYVESFIDGVAVFFDFALRRGDATCVIATPPVRHGLTERLRARGWDIAASSGHKRYMVIDAEDALQRFMRNGMPDPDRLAEVAAELDQYRRAVAEGTKSRLTIFGNMVTKLSEAGNAEGVIAVETLWNTVTHNLPFLTLCGYSSACFHEGVPGLWPRACAEHSVLSHASDV